MPYWSAEPTGSDYSFGAVGVYILLIKDRMFADAENVIAKSFPEQGIIASLVCLRLIGAPHRKNLMVHFRKRDFARAQSMFREWYDLTKTKIPAKHRQEIVAEAEREFELWDEQIFSHLEKP